MKTVRHRWRYPPDVDVALPAPGTVLVGVRGAWRVVDAQPVDSPIHPNDIRVTLTPIAWDPGDRWDLCYQGASRRVGLDPGDWRDMAGRRSDEARA